MFDVWSLRDCACANYIIIFILRESFYFYYFRFYYVEEERLRLKMEAWN